MKDGVTIKRWYPPKAIIVPPAVRPGSKQLTVIRHDNNGQYFVDECTERTSCPTHEDRRNIQHVTCPVLEFQVALVACQHYCSAPCGVHLDKLQQVGWYKNGEQAPYADKMKRRPTSAILDD